MQSIYLKTTHELFYTPFSNLGLQNLVCCLHLQRISIQTDCAPRVAGKKSRATKTTGVKARFYSN